MPELFKSSMFNNISHTHNRKYAVSKKIPRKTTHVARACINCKKAHLACDLSRPCKRCTTSGKCDTCIDVKPKKRGRPKLTGNREKTNNVSPAQIPTVPLVANTFASLLPMPEPVFSACSFNIAFDENNFAADALHQSEMMTETCSFLSHIL